MKMKRCNLKVKKNNEEFIIKEIMGIDLIYTIKNSNFRKIKKPIKINNKTAVDNIGLLIKWKEKDGINYDDPKKTETKPNKDVITETKDVAITLKDFEDDMMSASDDDDDDDDDGDDGSVSVSADSDNDVDGNIEKALNKLNLKESTIEEVLEEFYTKTVNNKTEISNDAIIFDDNVKNNIKNKKKFDYGYLGKLFKENNNQFEYLSDDDDVINAEIDQNAVLNVNKPFCLVCLGVQGN
jgi:hypothetical protein